MSGGKRIFPGIWLTTNHRYQVRVQDRTGSNKMATRTVDTLDEAHDLVHKAEVSRRAGSTATIAWKHSDTALRQVQPLTLAMAAREFDVRRLELVAASDPSRSGNHTDVNSLRSTSHGQSMDAIRSYLLPVLADIVTTDLTKETVGEMLKPLVANGMAVATQNNALRTLRTLIGDLPETQRPKDFPWPTVRPVRPAEPKKPYDVPRIWGGKPGDSPPALLIPTGQKLAFRLPACERIIMYFMYFMGLRRGEVMGLDNCAFTREAGRLWVLIHQQRSVTTGDLLPWVKSDASYRKLPIPRIIVHYIEMYWDRYHNGYRPEDGPAHRRHSCQLAVTSTGRDTDGGFMPARPWMFEGDFRRAKAALGLTHADLGYSLRPHHLRKTQATYLLESKKLRRDLEAENEQPRPDDDDPDAVLTWALERLELVERREREHISGADVSAWLGHASRLGHDDKQADAASPMTLNHYGSDFGPDTEPFCRIADFIDQLLRHDVGSLIDEPDERDTFLVLSPYDGEWMTLKTASHLTGISEATLGSGIRNGTYRGYLAWFADGDPKPPGPRFVLQRTEVELIVRRTGLIAKSVAAKRIGMSNNYIDGAIARRLVPVAERRLNAVLLDPGDVDALHERIVCLVARLFPTARAVSADKAFALFRSADSDDKYSEALAMIDAGATSQEAAAHAGLNANTLRSIGRRQRQRSAHDEPKEIRTETRALFSRPKRVKRPTFDGWVNVAVTRGLLVRANADHYSQRVPS